jgi:peptidoglycan/xylan/chitin deacetylase (PgdA/CDA1 family)
VTLLVVNHHYVAEEAPQAPRAIFPTTTAALEAELALLGRTFEFVSRDDLLDAVAGSRELPERACAITFDDGLRSQFELALPLLARLGVPGIFFVPAQPLVEPRLLAVHKLHAVREHAAPEALLPHVRDVEVDETRAAAMYRYDSPEAARVKFALNVALPAAERDAILDEVFAAELGDEGTYAADLYADAEQVAELARRGALGAHAYSHRPLAALPPVELDRELRSAVEVIERVAGERPRAISYPHGSAEAVDLGVAGAAAAAGFEVGFTMERALNRTLAEPLLLARIDVNDVGLVQPEGTGLAVRAPVTPGRTRYLEEAPAS